MDRMLSVAGPAGADIGTTLSLSSAEGGVSESEVLRRALPHSAIHRLTKDVRVSRVTRVLLDHVQEHGADCRSATVRPGEGCRSVKAALLDDLGQELTRTFDGLTPNRIDLVRRVQCAGAPFPVRIGVEIHGVPRRSVLLAGELNSQPVRLDQFLKDPPTTESH